MYQHRRQQDAGPEAAKRVSHRSLSDRRGPVSLVVRHNGVFCESAECWYITTPFRAFSYVTLINEFLALISSARASPSEHRFELLHQFVCDLDFGSFSGLADNVLDALSNSEMLTPK
jgi:hypothetical protein